MDLERNFEIQICLGLRKCRFTIHIHSVCPLSVSPCLSCASLCLVFCLCLVLSLPFSLSLRLSFSLHLSFQLRSSLVRFVFLWHRWLYLCVMVSISAFFPHFFFSQTAHFVVLNPKSFFFFNYFYFSLVFL